MKSMMRRSSVVGGGAAPPGTTLLQNGGLLNQGSNNRTLLLPGGRNSNFLNPDLAAKMQNFDRLFTSKLSSIGGVGGRFSFFGSQPLAASIAENRDEEEEDDFMSSSWGLFSSSPTHAGT